MLIATINNKEYALPDNWSDITLHQYANYVANVLPSTPEQLKAFSSGDKDALKGVSDLDYNATFLPFYCRSIAALSRVPYDLLMQCKKDQIEQVYSMLCSTLEQPKEMNVSACIIDGQRFNFPSQLMRNETVQDFVEAAQLEKHLSKSMTPFEVLPKIACILLRKDGEAYSDELLKREPTMRKMTMFIAWQLYFFLHTQKQVWNALIKIASPLLAQNKQGQAVNQS
jgi:hypothetical protein